MTLWQETYRPNERVEKVGAIRSSPFTQEPVPVRQLPPRIIQPIAQPGVHFHELKHVATIEGIVVSTDAGTPKAEARKTARTYRM